MQATVFEFEVPYAIHRFLFLLQYSFCSVEITSVLMEPYLEYHSLIHLANIS